MIKKNTIIILLVLLFTLLIPSCSVKENSNEVESTSINTLLPTITILPTPTATPTVEPTQKVVFPVFMDTTWPLPTDQILPTNIDKLTPLASWGYGLIYDAAVSADQTQLAVGTTNGFYIYDTSTYEVTSAVGTTSPVTVIAFSPDGKIIATGNVQNVVQLWNVSTSELIYTLDSAIYKSESGWNDELNEILFSTDGKYLEVTGTLAYSSYVKIWELSSGTNVVSFEDTSSCTVKISPNGSNYAVATTDSIDIYQFGNDTPITNLDIKNTTQIKYSPDGQFLAAGTGNIISIFNLVDGSTLEKVYGKEIDFSSDNSVFATTNENGTIDIYTYTSNETKANLKYYLNGYGTRNYFGTVNSKRCGGITDYGYGAGPQKGVLRNGVFSSDGNYIAVKDENYCAIKGSPCFTSLDRDENLAVYSLMDGSLVKNLKIPPDGYQWPDFKFEKVFFIGDTVLTLSNNTSEGAVLRIWDFKTNSLIKEINPIHPALPISFSPDSKKLVSYSLLNGSKLFTEVDQTQDKYHYRSVNEYEFSLWDIVEGSVTDDYEGGLILINRDPLRKGYPHPEMLFEVNFSPDGNKFTYNGYYYYYDDRNIPSARTWNIDDPQPTDETGIIAYSSNGSIARSNGNTIEIINGTMAFLTLSQDYGFVRCMIFSEDGTLLAAGYDHNIVVVWDTETGTPVQSYSTSPSSARSIRFLDNNRRIVVGLYDSLKIFSVNSGKLIKSLEDGSYNVGFDVSPVSDVIVTIPRTSWLNKINVYTSDGELIKTIHTPYRTNSHVSFSPDGTMLAISLTGSIQIWGIEPNQ